MGRLKHIIEANIVLGAWLIAAPFVLGYTGSRMEMGNDIAIGVLLIACSWWMLTAAAGRAAAEGLQLLGGLWLIAAPFVWQYHRLSRPFTNDIAVGILTVLVAATATWMFNAQMRHA
jgi:hypothetical protein